MQTITVTIGRNVGTEPLTLDAWNQYVSSVRRAVDAATSELWVATPYRGSWDGTPEDAFVFHGAALDGDNAEDYGTLPALRSRLAILATYYGQDAIGLAVGTGELVRSFATAVAEGATTG